MEIEMVDIIIVKNGSWLSIISIIYLIWMFKYDVYAGCVSLVSLVRIAYISWWYVCCMPDDNAHKLTVNSNRQYKHRQLGTTSLNIARKPKAIDFV